MKRGKMMLLLMALMIMALAACATAGKQFDRTHVNDIKKGVQTKEQIRAWFGEPYQVTKPLSGHPAGCVERWTYVHAYSSYGGARTESSSLIVDFDSNGKVCDHAFSETRK
jgi:outer membrane protein assembly factor BamE (lipoprotein component of BamABCDE complex)